MLVNNAGILRDRVIINMTEAEWDAVIAVHLKGHFCPTRHAAAYWREQTKAGKEVNASIVHTSSTSGLFSNPGPGELRRGEDAASRRSRRSARRSSCRYGVRSNAIAPGARARGSPRRRPDSSDVVKAPEDGFDVWDPANVSPFVAYLATADCPFTGETFLVQGGKVQRVQSWTAAEKIDKDDRWTVAELAPKVRELAAEDRRGSRPRGRDSPGVLEARRRNTYVPHVRRLRTVACWDTGSGHMRTRRAPGSAA